MKDVKIAVALHKEFNAPAQPPYYPVQAGACLNDGLGYLRDDEGENISSLNPYFCELTALYWAWKNLDCEYLGLVHYRRYFSGGRKIEVNGKRISVLSQDELEKLLSKTDVILPKKRRYFIETLYSHYAHTMYAEPLDETGRIIEEFYPEYAAEFARLKKRRSAHIFNMMIMKRELANDYCQWLFDILFKLKDRVDLTEYDAFHARFFGRISELLLDVYMNTRGIACKEVKVVYAENINWLKKAIRFLKAKFLHIKYETSDSAK